MPGKHAASEVLWCRFERALLHACSAACAGHGQAAQHFAGKRNPQAVPGQLHHRQCALVLCSGNSTHMCAGARECTPTHVCRCMRRRAHIEGMLECFHAVTGVCVCVCSTHVARMFLCLSVHLACSGCVNALCIRLIARPCHSSTHSGCVHPGCDHSSCDHSGCVHPGCFLSGCRCLGCAVP